MTYSYSIRLNEFQEVRFANYRNILSWEGGEGPGETTINALHASLSTESKTYPVELIDADLYFYDNTVSPLKLKRLKVNSNDQNTDIIALQLPRSGYYSFTVFLQCHTRKKDIEKEVEYSFIYLEEPREKLYDKIVKDNPDVFDETDLSTTDPT